MKTFKLDEHPKIEPGFTTPEGYFDELGSKINERIASEKQTPVIKLFSDSKRWIWAAAAVLMLALSIPVVNNIYQTNTAIDKATLENYLVNHAEITDEDIVDLMNEKEVEKLQIDLKLEDRDLEEALTGETPIEDYLLN